MKAKQPSERLTATAPAVGLWAVVLVWLASLFIINPWGNFPLNDDWSFGLAVKHLIEDHTFRPTQWTAMPLLTNVLWGGLFCLPAGFSFNALRLSTLTASLLGILGVWWLMRQSRQPQWLSALVALTLGFNPIYYALSNTFMTDVLFVMVSIFAAIFLLRHLKDGAGADLFIGTALAVLATLSRQLAIALPLAFGISLILQRGFAGRNVLRAAAPAAACIGVLYVFQRWMTATGRLPPLCNEKTRDLMEAIIHPGQTIPAFAYNTYLSLLYLGLFLSPVLICSLAGIWKSQRKIVLPLFAVSLWGVLLANFFYRSKGYFMPLSGNVLLDSGIGPLTLRDVFILHLNLPPTLPESFWKMATYLSMLGAACLVTLGGVILVNLAPKWRPASMNDSEITALFLLLSVIIYLTPLLATGFFDRYLIPAIPLLAVATTCPFQPFPRMNAKIGGVAAAILVMLSLLAICGTRDYLEWNRLRWRATDDLTTNLKVKADEIDGGFEFNGLHFYNPHYDPLDSKKSWWWVQKDTYLISDGPVPGYGTVKKYEYFHWLPPYTGQVLVLKKSGANLEK